MSDEAAFTPIEEAFFRAGEAEENLVESAPDVEVGVRRRPFLRRLFSRKQTQQ